MDLDSLTQLSRNGRYRFVRRLGVGASGDVYLVEDAAEAPRQKALKVLRAGLQGALVDGFRAEFRILASLDHPALARVYEFGSLADESSYYTSEYIDGRELGALRPEAWRDLCHALASVCRALAYVHSRGYVHNDVKPSNVVVRAGGSEVKLLDFGLAGLERAGSTSVYGTPGYVAPERLLGRTWDFRADLYSVGATAYRVLTGRRITEEAEPGHALASLRAGVPPLKELRPDLPSPLIALVERLLAFEPESRPRHAFDVVAALGRALGEAIPLETAGAARCYALSSVFVGRDDVVRAAERALSSALTGGSRRCLVISAGPGLGKTRLLSELVQQHEMRGGLAAWVRPNAADARLAPLLGAAASVGATAPDDESENGLLASFAEAAGRSRGGLLLAVDDAERLPEPVAAFILSLARHAALQRIPLAILMALSPGELPMATRQRIALALAAGEAERVELGPLNNLQVGEMLTSLFGQEVIPSRVQEDLVQRSSGNPLLLEELVRELVDDGRVKSSRDGWTFGEATTPSGHRSERLEEFLRRRVRMLPDVARDTLAALAALGGSGGTRALRAVLGEVDVELGLALLAEHALVRFDGGGAMVAHSPTLGVALESIAPERARKLHGAAAEWHSGQAASDYAIGRAWCAAGDYPRAWTYLVRHGQKALSRGEGHAAAAALDIALGLADVAGVDALERASATLAHAQSLVLVGRVSQALEMAERAYASFPASAHSERVGAAVEAVEIATRAGRASAMPRYVELARAASHPDLPFAEAQAAYAASVKAHLTDGELSEAERYANIATSSLARCASSSQVEHLALRLAHKAGMRALVTDFAQAVDVHRAILPRAEQTSDRALLCRILNNYGYALFQQRQLDEAQRVLQRALAEAEPFGNLALLPYILNNLAEVCQSQGDWRSAEELVRRASLIAREVEHPLPFAGVARVAWREGDHNVLVRAIDPYLAEPRARVLHAESLSRVLVVAGAAAASRADVAATQKLVALAEELRSRSLWPVLEVFLRVATAYFEATKAPAHGAVELRTAAERLESVGALSDALVVRRDAAMFFARTGDKRSARAEYEHVRQAHLDVGSGAGVSALDSLLAELDAKADARFEGVLPLPGRGIDDLLQNALRAAGFEQANLRWKRGDACGASDLVIVARDGDRLVMEQVGPISDELVSLLRALAEQLLHGSSATRATLASGVDTDMERSRAFELTVGPVELARNHAGIVGESSGVLRALALLERLAKSQAPVLISGETGTGKEVFARALHRASDRADGPFAVVNCAAIPEQLFEAELFGYRRGAFTGATRDHAGIVREADHGILFLDEIGELPPTLQPKLLRVLQEHTVRALGDDRDHRVDVRIVAATNRDLEVEVSTGRFRADLYWRLNVMEVSLPPLRDRVGDIIPLARHFLARFGRAEQTITKRVLRLLEAYAWPGNVRELENTIQRASILAGDGAIESRHLPARLLREPATSGDSLAARRRVSEREAISAMLRATEGNLTRAAERLGLTRQGLQFKLKQLGLTRQGHRKGSRGS